uniref:Uncharacterized protein n=1 Tax=Manihot esculenta TaxID=3983 RepID=A0A2C9US32_MANES
MVLLLFVQLCFPLRIPLICAIFIFYISSSGFRRPPSIKTVRLTKAKPALSSSSPLRRSRSKDQPFM